MTRDLRTLIYLHVLNLELREECSRTLGLHGYAIGEQQSKRTQSGEQQFKRTQSGSSSRSGRDRAASSSWTRGGGKRGVRAAVEADAAIGPGSSS